MSTFAFFGEIFMKIFHFGENLTFLLKKCETFPKTCDFYNHSQEYKWALSEEKTFSDCITNTTKDRVKFCQKLYNSWIRCRFIFFTGTP